MTFHVYRRDVEDGLDVLHWTDEEFKLAGYNLLYAAWELRGKPINTGWSVSANELIAIHSENTKSYEALRLVIDYYPSNMKRISLIEVREIYLFNWGDKSSGRVDWTPLMLKLRDVSDEWFDPPLTNFEERRPRMTRIEVSEYGSDFVEFLYLKGEDGGWNWGGNRATNAVFLHGEARDYFRQYF